MDIETKELIEQLRALVPAIQRIIETFDGPKLILTADQIKRMDELINSGVCLECGKKVGGTYRRGVCTKCYNRQRKQIAANKTTDLAFVAEGRRAPRDGIKTGRKPIDIPLPEDVETLEKMKTEKPPSKRKPKKNNK